MPARLKKEYPEEMTIVLQYEFENMVVHNHHFSLSLVFDTEMEHLSIPFNALLHLQDPNEDLDIELDQVNVYDLTKEDVSAHTPAKPSAQSTKKDESVIELSEFQD